MCLLSPFRSTPGLHLLLLLLCKQGDSATWVPVYKTEVRMNNLNPEWQPIIIKGTELNSGDENKLLRLKVGSMSGSTRCSCVRAPRLPQVWDYEVSGKHRLLGQADVTAAQLKTLSGAAAAQARRARPLPFRIMPPLTPSRSNHSRRLCWSVGPWRVKQGDEIQFLL